MSTNLTKSPFATDRAEILHNKYLRFCRLSVIGWLLTVGWIAFFSAPAIAQETSVAEAELAKPGDDQSVAVTQGFLKQYCVDCHQGEKPEGKFDVTDYLSPQSFSMNSKKWVRIIARIQSAEMPPVGSEVPSSEARESVLLQMRQQLQAAVCGKGPAPANAPIRRLNRTEYGATLRDLLGIQATLTQMLPEEGAGGEGFDNAAEVLFLSPLHAEKYLEAARAALDYASKDPRSRDVLLASGNSAGESPRGRRSEAGPQSKPPITAESAKPILTKFLDRAFRRPLQADEYDPYVALFEGAVKRGESAEQSLLFAMQGALVSPNFLFRIEKPNTSPDPKLVDDFELASRMSYFLWASMPDDELIRTAAQGKLQDTEILRAQTVRMLKDRRSREFAESFVEQWLGTRELGRNVKPDRTLNRGYSNELEWALKQEPVLFFQHILTENRPVLDLIDSNYTFLDSKLERHYQLKIGGTNQQLKRFDLPEDSHRGGVLGMAGVLAVTSLPQRTSPVLRGKWVRETLLGSATPPPPPNVPKLEESEKAATPKTIRELLEQHRKNPICASCHNSIDPIGFGLENYDLLGRWRTEEAGKPIDAKGELPDNTAFEGPQELKKVLLARKDEFVRHLTSKLLGFALGRGLVIEDQCTIEEIADKVRENDYHAHSLITEIVCSVPFRYHAGVRDGRSGK